MSVTPKSDAQVKAEIDAWRKNRKERLAREAAAKIAASTLHRPKVVTSDGVVIRDADVRLSPADPTAILRGGTEVNVRRPEPAWLAAPLKLKNPNEPHGIRNPFAIGPYDLELPRPPLPPSRDIDPMGVWSRNDD